MIRAILAAFLALACALQAEDAAAPRTLRSCGAVGDGRTDDRAAIEKALREAQGAPVDGEGATYTVRGTINVPNSVDLRNATFIQTLPSVDVAKYISSAHGHSQPQLQQGLKKVRPEDLKIEMIAGLPYLVANVEAVYPEDPVLTGEDLRAIDEMIHLRTIYINGTADHKVSARLENIKVVRGSDPSMGGRRDSAGIYIVDASPVALKNVEITGDGKGMGLCLARCVDVDLTKLNIHDITWSLYQGDIEPSAESLKKDFGWNNNPIYEYRDTQSRFVRTRVQEQLSGLKITFSENVRIAHTQISNLNAKVGTFVAPWQVDGMTIGNVKNLTIEFCRISGVWEGIDLTGGGVENFVERSITIKDTFSYGFKYAHPQKNGKIIDCTAINSGMEGFTISNEADNLEFTNCQALETGGKGIWVDGDRMIGFVAGFRLYGEAGGPVPKNVTLKDCSAINREFPGAMRNGFYCDPPAADPKLNNRLINPKVEGAAQAPVEGFSS